MATKTKKSNKKDKIIHEYVTSRVDQLEDILTEFLMIAYERGKLDELKEIKEKLGIDIDFAKETNEKPKKKKA